MAAIETPLFSPATFVVCSGPRLLVINDADARQTKRELRNMYFRRQRANLTDLITS